MAEVTFTDANFQEQAVDVKGKLVLVDFFATWCGPCKMMGPVIEELANEMDDVVIGKMNIDDNPETPGKFGVMSIPTLLFMKDGEKVGQLVGYQSKDALEAKIEELK